MRPKEKSLAVRTYLSFGRYAWPMDLLNQAPAVTLVFQTVLTHGPLTRAEVGRRTDLSPGAVTKAATPLLEDEWIVELGRPTGDRTAGRPATLVAVRPERAGFLGVKVTADELLGVRTDLTAKPLATRRAALTPGLAAR